MMPRTLAANSTEEFTMADKATAKKTKAPAKPRTTITGKTKVTQSSSPAVPSGESIGKVAAKPRKAATKKENATQASRPAMPPREEIERLAKSYWAQRGYVDGFAEQDWLRAEQELLQMAS
jgi:hypothetical protein